MGPPAKSPRNRTPTDLDKATELLRRLVEIVDDSEEDHHWTQRVEWLAEDAESFLEKLEGRD